MKTRRWAMQPVSDRYGRKPPHLARSFFSFGIPTKDWYVVIFAPPESRSYAECKIKPATCPITSVLAYNGGGGNPPSGGIHVVTETKRRNSAFAGGAVSDSRFHWDRLRSALPKDHCALCVDSRESLRE